MIMYKLTTYRTLTGTKEILAFPKETTAEWIVYADGKPSYHVNCFDLQTESNLQMNSLILSNQNPIETVLKNIGKKQNVHLTIQRKPFIEIEIKSEFKPFNLPPLPIEWFG